MKKRIGIILFLIGLALGFCACGKGEGKQSASSVAPAELSVKAAVDGRESLRYAAEEIPLPDGRRVDLLGGVLRLGERLYLCASLGEQTQICSLLPDGTDFQVLVPNSRRIWQFCADGDSLYALVDVSTETESRYYLAEMDTAGQERRSIDMAPAGAPEGWMPYRVEVSGGLVYALGTGRDGQTSLCVLDGETLLYSLACGSAALVKLPDGRVLLGQSGEGVYRLRQVDAEARELRDGLTLDLPLTYVSGDENSLYFSYQGSVLRMASDFSTAEKLLTLARVGIAGRQLLPEGEDFLCTDQEGKLYRLRPAGELGEDDGSCVLTIAVIEEFSVYPLDEYVMAWNKDHPDCLVEIKNYYVPTGIEGDPAGYEKGLDALALDITTGNIPDIYLLGRDMDPMLLTRKGYLEDLYPYMDADTEMGRDAFYQPLLRALEFRGGLYELPGWFYVETCIARKSVVGGPENWNFETLNRLRDETGCKMLFLNDMNRDQMFELLFLTHIYSSKLVDWETGTCAFDSPLYVSLLKAAAEFPAESDPNWWQYGASLQQAPEAPSALLRQDWAADCWVPPLHCWKNYGTEDYVILGYPELGTVFDAASSVAISAYSLHKQECWEFLKFDVSNSLQGHEESFNALSRNMDAHYDCMIVRESTKDPYWPDDIPWENLLEKYAGIEPMMREFRDQVDGCTAVLRQDRSIDKIVQSEAARFFAGQITAEQCAANIQSRARIYLAEQG